MASKSLTFDIFGRDRTASKALAGVGKSASSLTRVFAAVGAAIAAAFAVTRIVNFAKTTVTEFAAAEAAQNKLSDAFDRFPALVGGNIQALRDLNTELQKKTRFDDDALAAGQATLAQYGLTQDQLERLTPLLADYAAKTGKDVTDAALDLGKAFLGQGRALKNVGIDFVDTGTVAGNFEQVMAGLSAQVGGFAEKDAQTLTGQLEILKNAFGEVKESVGSLFAPAVGILAGLINDKLLPVLAILVDKYGPQLERFFTGAAESAGRLFDKLSAALSDGSIKDKLPVIITAFAALGSVLLEEGVLDSLKQLAVEVLPPLANALVAIAPAIPPIAAVLTAVLVPALQDTGTSITLLTSLIDALTGKKPFTALVQDILKAQGPLADVTRVIFNAFLTASNAIVAAANTIITAVESVINAFARLGGASVKLPRISGVTGLSLTPAGGGKGKGITKAADGAFFGAKSGGWPAIIGEGRDDEIAMPLNDKVYGRIAAGINGAGAGGANITIQMAPGTVIASETQAVQWFARAYQNVANRGGVSRTAFS